MRVAPLATRVYRPIKRLGRAYLAAAAPAFFKIAMRERPPMQEVRGFPHLVASAYLGAALRLEVDPLRIGTSMPQDIRDAHGPGVLASSFLWGGDWEVRATPLALEPRFAAMHELFDVGFRYEETSAYRAMVKLVAQGTPVTRVGIVLDSRQSIDRYWQQRVAIAEDMRCRGYRGPQKLALGGHEIGSQSVPLVPLSSFVTGITDFASRSSLGFRA